MIAFTTKYRRRKKRW